MGAWGMGRSGGWRWRMWMMGSAGQEDRRRDHLRGAGGTQREQAISYGSWYGQRRSRPSRPPAPTNNEPHERRSETGKSPGRRKQAKAKASKGGASESATCPRLLRAPPSLDRHQCDERRRGTVLLRCSSFALQQRVHKCTLPPLPLHLHPSTKSKPQLSGEGAKRHRRSAAGALRKQNPCAPKPRAHAVSGRPVGAGADG